MAQKSAHVKRLDRVVYIQAYLVVVAHLQKALQVNDKYFGKLLDCVALRTAPLLIASGAHLQINYN